jgi:hypothetical protein
MSGYSDMREAVKRMETAMELAGEASAPGDPVLVSVISMSAQVVQARALVVIAEQMTNLTSGRNSPIRVHKVGH